MLTAKAIFERKASNFDTRECVIEGIEFMGGKEFEEFSSNLLKDRNFTFSKLDRKYLTRVLRDFKKK